MRLEQSKANSNRKHATWLRRTFLHGTQTAIYPKVLNVYATVAQITSRQSRNLSKINTDLQLTVCRTCNKHTRVHALWDVLYIARLCRLIPSSPGYVRMVENLFVHVLKAITIPNPICIIGLGNWRYMTTLAFIVTNKRWTWIILRRPPWNPMVVISLKYTQIVPIIARERQTSVTIDATIDATSVTEIESVGCTNSQLRSCSNRDERFTHAFGIRQMIVTIQQLTKLCHKP